MQTVPAAARDCVVEREFEIVVAKKPVECRPGLLAPADVARYAIGFETRGDRARSLNRLLIEARFLAALAVEALRPDEILARTMEKLAQVNKLTKVG
jgi:hypothetical protein